MGFWFSPLHNCILYIGPTYIGICFGECLKKENNTLFGVMCIPIEEHGYMFGGFMVELLKNINLINMKCLKQCSIIFKLLNSAGIHFYSNFLASVLLNPVQHHGTPMQYLYVAVLYREMILYK